MRGEGWVVIIIIGIYVLAMIGLAIVGSAPELHFLLE